MPADEIDDLIGKLAPDPWRERQSFSADIQECHEVMFAPQSTRTEIMTALRKWLKTDPNQPCLFGRMAAGRDRISLCILRETDIARGDTHVRDVIQQERRVWKAEALEGKRHAFVIAMISETLAVAKPDENLRRVAERLCDLYLFDQRLEKKRHDVLRLGLANGQFFKWFVGVNVFAAQADGSWWNDHRIPGGLAFSMNSVGHMSYVLAQERLPAAANGPRNNLLNWALPTAMRTIHIASKRPLFGTRLMERAQAMICPAVPEEIRREVFLDIAEQQRSNSLRDLSAYSEHIYEGWYDTDESIPEAYFRGNVELPVGASMIPLYFTYLHSYKDADYASMGLGEQLFAADATDQGVEGGNKDSGE
jgi:hypothetical protein